MIFGKVSSVILSVSPKNTVSFDWRRRETESKESLTVVWTQSRALTRPPQPHEFGARHRVGSQWATEVPVVYDILLYDNSVRSWWGASVVLLRVSHFVSSIDEIASVPTNRRARVHHEKATAGRSTTSCGRPASPLNAVGGNTENGPFERRPTVRRPWLRPVAAGNRRAREARDQSSR